MLVRVCRAFRLVLTGPTASAHQPHHFPLTHLELYGFLTRATQQQQQQQQQQQPPPSPPPAQQQ